MYSAFAHGIAGCAAGDDPEVVALIHQYVPPHAIHTTTDENGVERISGLGLPNDPSTLKILPHLDELERLRRLHIGYERLTDEDLGTLPRLSGLRELWIGNNLVTDEGLKHLAGMKELRYLKIRGAHVEGPGLARLEDSSKLERLDLGANPLGDSAIPHIVRYFKKLRQFDFDETNVTIEGFIRLAELPWLTNVAFPKNMIEAEGDPKADREAVRDVLRQYVRAYKESKRRARAAGEEVPPDHVGPFGLIE
jgi:hypothetical protein